MARRRRGRRAMGRNAGRGVRAESPRVIEWRRAATPFTSAANCGPDSTPKIDPVRVRSANAAISSARSISASPRQRSTIASTPRTATSPSAASEWRRKTGCTCRRIRRCLSLVLVMSPSPKMRVALAPMLRESFAYMRPVVHEHVPYILGSLEQVRRRSDSEFDYVVGRSDAGVKKLQPASAEGDQVPDERLSRYLPGDGCRDRCHAGSKHIPPHRQSLGWPADPP